MSDMVHSRKEGLAHSGQEASIPGGDEAGGAGHTRGPWRAKSGSTPYPECDDADSWIAVLSPAGREVITLYERYSLAPDDRGCWEADARLIAAAPELLKTLEDLRDWLALLAIADADDVFRSAPERFDEIQTAISKAVGDVKRDADPIQSEGAR